MLTKFDKALAALIVSGLVPILNYLFGWTLDADVQAVAVTLLTGFFVWLVPNKTDGGSGGTFRSILPVLLVVGLGFTLAACGQVTKGYATLCDELDGTYDTSGRGSCNDSDLDRWADELLE